MYACMYYSAKLPVQRTGVYFLVYVSYAHTHCIVLCCIVLIYLARKTTQQSTADFQ